MVKIEKTEKEIAVEKYIKKSLSDTSVKPDTKYRICSKCGATIPQDTKKCACGAEYTSTQILSDLTSALNPNKNAPDTMVDTEFSALKESFSSAENELEKIAEEIAASVKGDLIKKEAKFQETATTMQDTILQLQQEISDMKNSFDKVAENIASEVREEIKKHEEGRIHVMESNIKDTLDKLQTNMKREGLSLKEEDSKIKNAKKELYEEVNKLMEHLKNNEKEIMDKERTLSQKELELEKLKNELEYNIAKKESDLEKRKFELENTMSNRNMEDLKKAEEEWKRVEHGLKNEIDRMKKSDENWKNEETRLKTEIDTLKKASDDWKKEEARFKSVVMKTDIPGIDISKHEEIAKLQSKILVALLKENPDLVKKVIKSLNISKDDLKRLVS